MKTMRILLKLSINLLSLYLVISTPISQPSLKKSFFEAPHFAVSKTSKEGLDIAQKIAELFRKKNRPINIEFPSKDGFQTTKIASSATKETSINFNFNVAVDIADGKITRIRLPHGDLLLLFIAADDRNRVNVNAIDFQDFLAKTIGSTNMVQISKNKNIGGNNGIAFMSWAKPDPHKNKNLDANGKHVRKVFRIIYTVATKTLHFLQSII